VPRSYDAAVGGADDVVDLNAVSPLPVDREVLESGQLHFEVFCAACHGRLGNGEGMIVQRGFTRPPSFHVERLRAAPDAHLYNVITRGFGAMLGYGDRVRPGERWAIVAYVRALQSASDPAAGPSDELRRALIAQGDRPLALPASSPGTPGTPGTTGTTGTMTRPSTGPNIRP
jgi:mono/diheme cytochrome c family protein